MKLPCGPRVPILLAALAFAPAARAQPYQLLIKGGHVIDARNGIDGPRDVAIQDGKIAAVAADIKATDAKLVVPAKGLYVVPGLVDIHAHVFHGVDPEGGYSNGQRALPPDGFTFRAGVTTVVDAGGSGWRNFPLFKRQVIDGAQTRVLALLNIVGAGMAGDPAEQNTGDMDARLCALRVTQFPKIIVGIKTAHFRGPEWTAVDRAVEAGRMANVPVMVDFGEFVSDRPWRQLVTQHLRPGDIYTHFFLGVVPLLDPRGHVQPYVHEARRRGIIFDVGHGGGSFVFRQAVPAMKEGFWPDSLSTDLHINSMNSGMKDMTNLMSKFLAMGMPLKEVVARATWNPAREIKRDDLGHLGVGAVADVAVLSVDIGKFGYTDVDGGKLEGIQRLQAELTVRAGNVVWDLNGISRPEWSKVPPKNEPDERWPPARH
ncbi:MAG TPA: amidohydrolase/deacetylase family metallohydrolase [Polyangia bacterium]|nr:amidohydrolase/deacetylase family metallohydrolase [Polyangia bacterium]